MANIPKPALSLAGPELKLFDPNETLDTVLAKIHVPPTETIDLSGIDLSGQSIDVSRILVNNPNAAIDFPKPSVAGNDATIDLSNHKAGADSSTGSSLSGKEPTPEKEIEVGDTLPLGEDKFLIIKKFDNGKHGVVYKAESEKLGRVVALKRLRLGKEGSISEQKTLNIVKEARALASIDHNNVVQIFDLHQRKDTTEHWFVYQFVNGTGLDTYLETNPPLEPRQTALLGRKLADALAAVHEKGLCHRDVKPANIIVTDKLEPKLVDFGVAMPTGKGKPEGISLVAGSPSYMAPEVARAYPLFTKTEGLVKTNDAAIDGRADIYSLGMVLLEAITGKSAFPLTETSMALSIKCAASAEPIKIPDANNQKFPSELRKIICTALEKDPVKRYQSAAQMRDELDSYLETTRATSKTTSWQNRIKEHPIQVGLATTTLLVGGVLANARKEPEKPLPATSGATGKADVPKKPGATTKAAAPEKPKFITKDDTDIVALENWKIDGKIIDLIAFMEPLYKAGLTAKSKTEFEHRESVPAYQERKKRESEQQKSAPEPYDEQNGRKLIISSNVLKEVIRHFRSFAFDPSHPEDQPDRKGDLPLFITRQLKPLILKIETAMDFAYDTELPFNMDKKIFAAFIEKYGLVDSEDLRAELVKGLARQKDLVEQYKKAAEQEQTASKQREKAVAKRKPERQYAGNER